MWKPSGDVEMISVALGRELGVSSSGDRFVGTLDGAPVRGRVQILQREGHVDRSGRVHARMDDLLVSAELRFDVPLDAGLKVRATASWEALRISGRTGADERLSVWEVDRGGATVVPPEAREALDRSFVGDPGPAAGDFAILWAWRASKPWPTVEQIAAAIRELPTAWHAIGATARRAPPRVGTEAAMVVLAGLSLPEGLEISGSPAGIVGVLDGIGLSVTVVRADEDRARLMIHVLLDGPLPGSPRIVAEPQFGWIERLGALFLGRREITVGDPAFDDRFAVRSYQPEALLELLGPEVRDGMLRLDALVPIQLDPARVYGSGEVALADVPEVVARAIGLARAFAE